MNAEPSSSTRRRSRADTLEGPTERVGPGQLGEFRALLEAEPHYPVEGRLGEGGSAMVFLSSQPRIGRRVAIKSLKPEHRGPRAVQRLLQEAWVLGQVRHPNVVALHDVHLARDGFPRLVLERVVGVPWLDVIQRPDAHAARFGERGEAAWHLQVLIAVCNAIAFAHDRGIVHRDLKPENVMIGDYGEVVLLDWGLAVCIGSTDDPRAPTLGKHPSVAGTPAYLAPEMLGAPGEIDARTDIFLLGAVLFEVVTGRPPHRGDSLDALLADAATPVEIPRSVPAALRTICARAMAFDPADRYPSAGSFRDAIERYLMHERSTSIAARAETAAMRFREQDAEGYAPDAPEVTIPFERARRELHAALELWPANEAARSALGALVALRAARYLEVDEPHRAATLLRELDEPPPALAVQIDAALAREEEERAVGQAIRSSRDNASGRAIRVRAALAFGALWTLSPLLGARLVGDSPFLVPGLPLLYLSVAAVMSVRLQRIIRADHFNRILFGVVALVLVAEALLGASGVALGVATSATAVLLFSLRMLAAGFIGLVVHHRFFWVASIYALGMVLSVVWHGAEPYLTAGCNAFAALTAAGGWIVDARFTAANRPAVGTEAGEGFPYG